MFCAEVSRGKTIGVSVTVCRCKDFWEHMCYAEEVSSFLAFCLMISL